MDNLVKRAKELLENKTVQVIIGYEAGPTGVVRPAFITDPARADRLRSAGPIAKNDFSHSKRLHTPRCRLIAPLGAPVEPEVYST